MAAASPDQPVTGPDIISRVRSVAPEFRKRAAAAEVARRLPQESARELIDAGIARMLVPKQYGGAGLGLDTWVETMREISKADASHGWCAGLLAHHPHYVAQFSEKAQQEVWADGPDVAIAASVQPAAQVHTEAGGYRVSGRSPFASGVGHCSWVMVGGMAAVQGPPEPMLFLVAPGDYSVADTWFTAGMCATGSNTIVTDNVFVPASRAIRMADLREGTGPGGEIHANPIYRAPLTSYAPLNFAVPMLGAAQGAYELFREWTKTRQATGGGSVAEVASIQARLARVAADIDAAEMLMCRVADTAQTVTPPSLTLRARSIRDYTRASEFATEAIDTLMSMSGTAAFGAAHPLQRAWRDIHFAAMHISLNAERNYCNFGRIELGVPRDPANTFF